MQLKHLILVALCAASAWGLADLAACAKGDANSATAWNICQVCHVTCKTCYGGAANQCKTCLLAGSTAITGATGAACACPSTAPKMTKVASPGGCVANSTVVAKGDCNPAIGLQWMTDGTKVCAWANAGVKGALAAGAGNSGDLAKCEGTSTSNWTCYGSLPCATTCKHVDTKAFIHNAVLKIDNTAK